MTSAPTATTNRLPSYLAPLPRRVEDFALRYAWVIVAINLAGTAFGFWYYRFQLAQTPIVMWPFVPDSPAATLFVALSLAAWKLDYDVEWLHMLAFFGNIKLGLWTPFVQLVLNGPGGIEPWLYWFLIVSHLAMSLQSFLIYRYAEFTVGAVAVTTVWYGLNDIVDYFAPLVGEFHHTFLRAELVNGALDHSMRAHDLAAAAAVTLTLAATFLALATRVKKLETTEESSARGVRR
ncbi:DUF1405 domain-containing protein [Halonotius terrestris]|jgi:uncharacterized membrane protein YpjA|uniref:DUF1405 domain-containing protein n=1 Tax=Halonotius terrestris TaxID=2487750 RepID=A0A8J8P9G2_9EURY|nr:DUF1405 domain-containing protein [Halonotius terrestris]TQQ78433.1 DUF1405 domain-containing protein [Halonotius terrestris]